MTRKKKNSVETAVLADSATQPVREYPEEAYCFTAEELKQSPDSEQVKAPSPAKRTRTEEPRIRVRKPDYTLEDLLAQLPKSETPESNADAETAAAKGYATQPVREYPEEAYDFEFEDPGYTLEDLLAQVTEDNRHEVVDFGPPVGKEVW